MWSDAGQRYSTEMVNIFSAENKLQIQLQIEATLAKVQAKLGIISEKEAEQIANATGSVRVARVHEIDAEIHHDLMAVVKALSEQAGDAGGKVHLGATSNDIQDTTLALQLVQSKTLLLDSLDEISVQLCSLASDYKDLACIGRTHGQHAVPTTVGFKFANFLHELQLAKEKLYRVKVNISKFSGAVGNYASTMRTDIETLLLDELGLEPLPISTQVIPRVVHADYLNAVALCSSVLERISKEIRNLQRSEIQEWFEPFGAKQVGSSAMPHKRNPHKSERISGLTRIIRSNVAVALENIALEHERDISHSSVERIIIPESMNLALYISKQMYSILNGIEINEEGINRNLQMATKSKSEQILKLLVDTVGRQEGHELIRQHLHSNDFQNDVMNDTRITNRIPEDVLSRIFDEINTGLASQKTEYVCQRYNDDWVNYRTD